MEQKLRHILDSIIQELAETWAAPVQDLTYDIQVSKDPAHGDYAANAAFKVARQVRKSPKAVAEEIKKLIEARRAGKKELSFVTRVEVAGAGFLNFYVSQTAVSGLIDVVLRQDERYGESEYGVGKKVVVEFVSANPTG